MSFLKALTDKKRSLNKTETTVTCADGRIYREKNGENLGEISRNTYGFVVDNKPDGIPAKITEFLYLGSQDCCDTSVLTKYDITYVLSIDLPETNIVTILKNDCYNFIRTAIDEKRSILVHCNAGVSRSSAIVIGYLMLANDLDYQTCYDVVKKARCSINPNVGFTRQLKCLK